MQSVYRNRLSPVFAAFSCVLALACSDDELGTGDMDGGSLSPTSSGADRSSASGNNGPSDASVADASSDASMDATPPGEEPPMEAKPPAEPPPCGAIPHGGSETRTAYQSASVPFGQSCAAETQTRSCSSGQLSAWSGTFQATSCSVAAPRPCGATPHGGRETRVRYQAATVRVGQTCSSETQTRTCQNGAWSAWSGTFAQTACVVENWCNGIPPSGPGRLTCAIQTDRCANGSVPFRKILTAYGTTAQSRQSNCVRAGEDCLNQCGAGSSARILAPGPCPGTRTGVQCLFQRSR